jgi:hypothetical protein
LAWLDHVVIEAPGRQRRTAGEHRHERLATGEALLGRRAQLELDPQTVALGLDLGP